jgi:hypothetical protein
VTDLDWNGLFASVAAELRRYHDAGLQRLLTEDVVRFATVRALVGAGVAAADLRVEWAAPVLKGGHVDLVVGDPTTTAVEFKFPREPVEKNAAWTQALGEVMKDYYRVAVLPPDVQTRLTVLVSTARLRRYLGGVADRHGVDVLAGQLKLIPAQVLALPPTALRILGEWARTVEVTAHALPVAKVDEDVWLQPYRVDAAVPGGTTG